MGENSPNLVTLCVSVRTPGQSVQNSYSGFSVHMWQAKPMDVASKFRYLRPFLCSDPEKSMSVAYPKGKKRNLNFKGPFLFLQELKYIFCLGALT
jgi:hypothetical protein